VKFLLDNWMLIAMALASGLALLFPTLNKGQGLSPQDMVQLMNREKAIVIDVCEPDEFARGHVIGAKNLPLGQLEDKLAQLVKSKSAQVVMVCQVGARSARAAATAPTSSSGGGGVGCISNVERGEGFNSTSREKN
jgi:rhodanese-related sulfurtransferase